MQTAKSLVKRAAVNRAMLDRADKSKIEPKDRLKATMAFALAKDAVNGNWNEERCLKLLTNHKAGFAIAIPGCNKTNLETIEKLINGKATLR